MLAATTHPERFSGLVPYATYAECDEPAADVRRLLPQVVQRTLVLHRSGDPEVGVRFGRALAAQIPEGELVELPGDHHAAEADAV